MTTARNDLGVIFAESEAGKFHLRPVIHFFVLISSKRSHNDTYFMARNALSQNRIYRETKMC